MILKFGVCRSLKHLAVIFYLLLVALRIVDHTARAPVLIYHAVIHCLAAYARKDVVCMQDVSFSAKSSVEFICSAHVKDASVFFVSRFKAPHLFI